MAELTWDAAVDRKYENGVDHGILFVTDDDGEYTEGVAWNGLTTVTESPTGAESNKQYADNIVYADIQSAEEFAATIEAFTYPIEFEPCNGNAMINGVAVGQQLRRAFGFYYRTRVASAANPALGFKHHLVYGGKAAPSEKANATVNDSPEPVNMSWDVTTVPTAVGTVEGVEYTPTATLTIDSTTNDPDNVAALLEILYGTSGDDSRLPLPSEVFSLFASGTLTDVDWGTPANQPTYVSATHIVTLPTVTGVSWKINGVAKANGAQPALTVGQTAVIEPVYAEGYKQKPGTDDDWTFNY